jgi:hypothetical protein
MIPFGMPVADWHNIYLASGLLTDEHWEKLRAAAPRSTVALDFEPPDMARLRQWLVQRNPENDHNKRIATNALSSALVEAGFCPECGAAWMRTRGGSDQGTFRCTDCPHTW